MAVNLVKIQNIAVLCFGRRLELITSFENQYFGKAYSFPPLVRDQVGGFIFKILDFRFLQFSGFLVVDT